MNKKSVGWFVLLAFFVGTAGSVVFNRFVFPALSGVRGLEWVGKLQSSSPVVINRREEVRLNEGVNLIELTKQAQTFVVSIYSTGVNAKLLGNGIIITSDGTIFTTKEVLGANNSITVVTDDGTAYPGVTRAMDPKSQLAVISVAGRDMPVAQFSDARNMQTAQRLFALGRTTQEFNRRFASGLVTSTMSNVIDFERVRSTESFEGRVTMDAELGADFIGGPVVNLQGLVIGMVVSANGQILPSEAIDGALRTYLETGKVSRPYIGMEYLAISKSLARVKGLSQGGAQVVTVAANSPAAKSGLVANDLVTEVNGQRVEDSTLEQVLLQQGASQLTLKVRRGQEELQLSLVVETR